MNIPEQLLANFYRWERLGRGVRLFDAPVALEPPFDAFLEHRLVFDGLVDSGWKKAEFSGWQGGYTGLQPTVDVAATREMAVRNAKQLEV